AALLAAQQTAVALKVVQASSSSELATAQAKAADIQATVNALATQQVIAAATAPVLSEQTNTGVVEPSAKAELATSVHSSGRPSGSNSAVQDAANQIGSALAKSQGCQVGFTETFGYSNDLADGVAIAKAVNELLKSRFPEFFANAVVNDFANVGQG